MKTEACAGIIQDALAKSEGIVSARADIAGRTITVTFDGNRLAIKNVEMRIADAGFDANRIPAKPEAKASLPTDCR
jgi:copper chaperone CopZ